MIMAKTGASAIMPRTAAPLPMRPFHRLAILAVLATAGTVLAGCGSMNRDNMATGSIPDDYRTRHPITLAEVEHTLDVPVASGDRRMTVGTRDAVNGFIADYRLRSTGVIHVQYPQGSMNAEAASYMRRDIRSMLSSSGISSPKIVESSYGANETGDAAPIRLSFMAITAMTDECGKWPEDIANNTIENKNYHNFGCASQNNLAAQIANPMDLVTPRAMSPIDAEQRSNVIKTYRDAPSATE